MRKSVARMLRRAATDYVGKLAGDQLLTFDEAYRADITYKAMKRAWTRAPARDRPAILRQIKRDIDQAVAAGRSVDVITFIKPSLKESLN